MRAFFACLRADALRLLRMRETLFYFLFPAAFLVPIGLMGAVIWESAFEHPTTVAIPLDTPAELPMLESLTQQELVGVPHADPAAALAREEVDFAILRWETGEGIRDADRTFESAVTWRWHALVDGEGEDYGKVVYAVERAGKFAIETEVILAGGDPDHDL